MCSTTSLPPELAVLINHYSKEELQRIGHALIDQTKSASQEQYQMYPPYRPQRTSNGPPSNVPPHAYTNVLPPLMNHQQQQTIRKVRPLMEQQQQTPISSSTPRRPASDSFDTSGDNYQRMPKRARNNEKSPRSHQNQRQSERTRPEQPQQQHQNVFNINMLRRVVSNNLPCFFIQFEKASDCTNNMSCTQVAITLKKLFMENELPVKELSMCIHAGERRYKFAVNEKRDFITLFRWNWPDQIEGAKVEIMKPRTLPDCLALVVRYIPTEVPEEIARVEVMKAIPAATSFSVIRYQHRHRPSFDLRFCVMSVEQYQTALELGRIAIGQFYLPVTHFLAGHRMIYCTACWKLGHMRDHCKAPVSCRKCLTPFTQGVHHSCQDNDLTCAQCGGDHYSLDPACPAVRKYKTDLKAAVEKALADGVIRRTPPGEVSRPYTHRVSEFPVLNQAPTEKRRGWNLPTSAAELTTQGNELNSFTEAIKGLTSAMVRFESNLKEMNHSIEQQNKRNTMQGECVSKIIDVIQTMSNWVQASNKERTKLKKNVVSGMEDLQKWRQHLASDSNGVEAQSNLISHVIHNSKNDNNISTGESIIDEDTSMNPIGQDA